MGSQFGSRIGNEEAVLNINDMISLEQSMRVKVIVFWPSGKTDVQVPDEKENIALVKISPLKTGIC